MIYLLPLPVHSLEVSKKRNALVYTLTSMPTLPSYGSESASPNIDILYRARIARDVDRNR